MTDSPEIRTSETALPLIVTDAGRAAAIAANDAGLQLQISEVAIGSGQWTPDETATALKTEIKRLDNLGGAASGPDMIFLSFSDAGNDEYRVGEFGLYSDTGVLFAIYSRTGDWITEKTDESILMLSIDIKLDSVPPGSVTVTGNNFVYPPATETLAGVLKIATQEKVLAGQDHDSAVTPKTLSALLPVPWSAPPAIAGQTVFTAPQPMTRATVYINGVFQDGERGAYSISGKTLTFSEPLDAGDEVFVVMGTVLPAAKTDELPPPEPVWKTIKKDYTARAGDKLLIDSRLGGFTVTLPANPARETTIEFMDAGAALQDNPVLIDGDGEPVNNRDTMTVGIDKTGFSLLYFEEYGWRVRQ